MLAPATTITIRRSDSQSGDGDFLRNIKEGTDNVREQAQNDTAMTRQDQPCAFLQRLLRPALKLVCSRREVSIFSVRDDGLPSMFKWKSASPR